MMSYAGAQRLAPKGMFPDEPEAAPEPPTIPDRWEAHRWAWRVLCQAYLGRDELFPPEPVRVRPPFPEILLRMNTERPPINGGPPWFEPPPVDMLALKGLGMTAQEAANELSKLGVRPRRPKPPPTPVPGSGTKVSM